MIALLQPWVKIVLIIVGSLVLLALIIFLYLLIAGSDESRKNHKSKQKTEESINGRYHILDKGRR